MKTWTLIHENESRTEIRSTVNLRLAFESGYRWVNKGEGNGWQQLAYLLRRS